MLIVLALWSLLSAAKVYQISNETVLSSNYSRLLFDLRSAETGLTPVGEKVETTSLLRVSASLQDAVGQTQQLGIRFSVRGLRYTWPLENRILDLRDSAESLVIGRVEGRVGDLSAVVGLKTSVSELESLLPAPAGNWPRALSRLLSHPETFAPR